MTAQLAFTLLVPIAYVSMWIIEARHPARAYADVPRWHATGLIFFFVIAATGTATPLLWEHVGLTSFRVLNLRDSSWWGYPLGLLTTTAAAYGWHRLEHRFDLLWRMAHQLHHSALRVDIPGSFYSHPMEVIVKTTLGLVVGTVLLGLSPIVAAAVSTTVALLSMFQHWNINTPHWLGWFIPRPEMHALHHEYGVHARNYGDLPVWDMLFGTYANPQHFMGRVGFEPDESTKIRAMLLMKNVSSA